MCRAIYLGSDPFGDLHPGPSRPVPFRPNPEYTHTGHNTNGGNWEQSELYSQSVFKLRI